MLTTNDGVPVSDNQNSLKAGPRDLSLFEDFVLREKIHHFDHEWIPERIVHARNSGTHGTNGNGRRCRSDVLGNLSVESDDAELGGTLRSPHASIAMAHEHDPTRRPPLTPADSEKQPTPDRKDEILEGDLENTFPASDPPTPKHIT